MHAHTGAHGPSRSRGPRLSNLFTCFPVSSPDVETSRRIASAFARSLTDRSTLPIASSRFATQAPLRFYLIAVAAHTRVILPARAQEQHIPVHTCKVPAVKTHGTLRDAPAEKRGQRGLGSSVSSSRGARPIADASEGLQRTQSISSKIISFRNHRRRHSTDTTKPKRYSPLVFSNTVNQGCTRQSRTGLPNQRNAEHVSGRAGGRARLR